MSRAAICEVASGMSGWAPASGSMSSPPRNLAWLICAAEYSHEDRLLLFVEEVADAVQFDHESVDPVLHLLLVGHRDLGRGAGVAGVVGRHGAEGLAGGAAKIGPAV